MHDDVFYRRWTRAALAVCLVAPASFASMHIASIGDAAHDLSVIRTLGFGWTGVWRALDLPIAALALWAPIGTRAARAALASAALAGIGGALLFALARALVAECAPTARRIGPAAAAVAILTATLGVAWQLEAGAPGGSVTGALLVFAPLALAARGEPISLGAALGLAASYEPLVGLAALAGTGAFFALLRRRPNPRTLVAFAIAAAAPIALALARTRADLRLLLPRAIFAAPLGEAGASERFSPLGLVHSELGWVFAALALAGMVLAFVVPRARPLAAAIAAIAIVGIGGVAIGAPAGPTRWAPTTLAALAALAIFAAVAMQALVRAIAEARVPFAAGSAAMVVVLELAFPARVADDAWTRAEERARGGVAAWDEAAWGTVPFGAVVLLADARALERTVAARAAGTMRDDLAIVPIADLGGPMAGAEIAKEPHLAPFVRDMALVGAPEELSLSSLASARPLAMVFDPRWDRALARHLLPAGLVACFEPEPRGASDRRHALEIARPDLAWFERSATSPCAPELCAAAASLLRARAIGFAAAGDREMIARGLDDLRPFAPGDRVASELVRRVVLGKGATPVKDLVP